SMCTGEDAKRLGRLEPRCNSLDCRRRTLVHGDGVLGNLIRSNDRLTVIDWQCPGIGDPADDIACFLPPGMQMTNGGVVDASLIEAFMETCPCRETIVRYRKLLPPFTGRWPHTAFGARNSPAPAIRITMKQWRPKSRRSSRSMALPRSVQPRPAGSVPALWRGDVTATCGRCAFRLPRSGSVEFGNLLSTGRD
ncbi:MAG: phosphotransferase, partial [Rhodobacteraceae bacterium]|nr:phosphotransferase [Paracoccaceae bacterium]